MEVEEVEVEEVEEVEVEATGEFTTSNLCRPIVPKSNVFNFNFLDLNLRT